MDDYIIIPDEKPEDYKPMPDGLHGYWWETEHVVCIPLVIAEQKGKFTPFLEALEHKGKLLFVPTVSAELAAKLLARGYLPAVMPADPLFGPVGGLAKDCGAVCEAS